MHQAGLLWAYTKHGSSNPHSIMEPKSLSWATAKTAYIYQGLQARESFSSFHHTGPISDAFQSYPELRVEVFNQCQTSELDFENRIAA